MLIKSFKLYTYIIMYANKLFKTSVYVTVDLLFYYELQML